MVDGIKQHHMKEKTKRVRQILVSKLNARNLISVINSLATTVVQYGAENLKWTEKINEMDGKSRKFLTVHANHLPHERKGLISVEACVHIELENLMRYLA